MASSPRPPTPSLSPLSTLRLSILLFPNAPRSRARFFSRNARKPGFSRQSPLPGQILPRWLNFSQSSVFLQDLFLKPFCPCLPQAQRSTNGYIFEPGDLRAGYTGPLTTDQITPGS